MDMLLNGWIVWGMGLSKDIKQDTVRRLDSTPFLWFLWTLEGPMNSRDSHGFSLNVLHFQETCYELVTLIQETNSKYIQIITLIQETMTLNTNFSRDLD